MKLQNLGILIVAFKSDKLIGKILNNLKSFNVIIIENSKSYDFKHNVEKNYPNVKCIIPEDNLGYGSALNLGFKNYKFENYLILNPDVEITENQVIEIYECASNNPNISVLAPSTIDNKNRTNIRHGFFKFLKKQKSEYSNLIKVHFVIGHAFLIKSKILENSGYFDENYFLNFEELDLFFRIFKEKYNVYVMKNCSIKHLEGKSSDYEYFEETSKISKWHFSWGYYYFYKKNYGKVIAYIFSFFYFFSCLTKYIYFFIKNDKYRQKLLLFSIKGLFASLNNKKSFLRPEV